MVAFNEAIGLWAQWKDILSDLMNEQRQADADAFFQEHREAMLEGARVLWPGRMPYVELMKSKLFEGDVAFAFEYQNDPVSGGSLFDMANAGFFSLEPEGLQRRDGRFVAFIDLVRLVAFYDPSMGGGPQSDFGCCVVVAEDRHGFRYALDCYIGQDPSSVQCERVAELLYRWQVSSLGLESNGFQGLLSSDLRQGFYQVALSRDDPSWSVLLIEVTHSRSKVVRIATLEGPNLAKGQILANVALCRVCQWQTFVHVQGEGPVRVHVQPLQRCQSTQVRGRQPPLPCGLCEHLLDHQGIDVYGP